MMLPHDVTDHAEARRPDSTEPYRPGGILLFGYLRKLKRMKKKYFILTADSESNPARLEYFDSEKKWKNGQTAKRSIVVKSCFNINRKTDCKHKFAVAIYTNEDCFPIAFDSEEELLKWFITLLQIHLADKISEGEELKPIYEHVWQVTVQRKELGSRKNIVGPYRLCLNTTTRVLTLFKMPLSLPLELWEFPVMTIRRCGHNNCVFFMEMGRGTMTGAGELFMELEEAAVAQNVHVAVMDAMRNSAREDLGPRPRTRSSSANEQNRPSLQHSWNPPAPSVVPVSTTAGLIRNRADSVPSRSRTTSENATVVTPTHDSRPSSVIYAHEGISTSPPMTVKSIPNSFSMDDMETPLHPVNNYIRSRLSHTATPENSLPKESTILEEDRNDAYLMMSHVDQPPSTSDYLCMTPRGPLSSSPSAPSVSTMIGSSRTLSNTSIRGGYKNRVTPVPSGAPPIKPPLHPQNPYMDMSSPVTTSSWASPPASAHDGYLPMYPSGSAPGSVGTRSGTHTRSSSFCDEPPESYVPMAPQSVASSVTSRDEEGGSYMDMQYRRSVPREAHHLRGRLSPASGSSLASSFTSGTPPAGRFQEYHLEKVSSFLTPSEDDDSLSSLSCRQSRAYSVGSRPEIRGRKMAIVNHDQVPAAVPAAPPPSACTGYTTTVHTALANQDARVRAYSVGSRVTPGNSKLSASSNGSSSSVSSSRHELEPAANANHLSPTHGHQQQPDESQRKKSLSVPYLGTSTPAGSVANIPYAGSNPTGTFFRTLLSQQQTAVQRENNLMEIEFARALSGLNVSSDSFLGIDQVDCAASSSYTGQFGSSDSVGRSSVASTNSSTAGAGGRPRSASNQSRPSFGSNRSIVSGKPKLDSFRSREGRLRLERLESVPQGRDQDYIEYGESRQHLRGVESPDVSGPKSVNKAEHDQDSADEYVELAHPNGRLSNVRLSVSESEQVGRVVSPGSDYMSMDGSKNKMVASMSTVLCQLGQDPSSSYIDMNYNSKRTPSHPGSVSDDFTYLPMDYTPRSSRNPSRQSSQADLILALGAVSPSMRGSQTPRSESARHSRTEESLQEQHYMEMTFDNPSESSLRADKSVRSRIPSPYDGSQTDSETQTVVSAKGSSKKSAFLSNLFGRKSFSAGKSATSPTAVTPADSGTLPRSSRSMPPSPFSSLKRPSKSSKSRRTTTAGSIAQSLSPVSPDVDLSSALLFHQRSQSMRSHSIGHSRSSLHSPLTPPSPSADFSMIHPQFSPPSPSVALTSKPGSSQPISISLQRQTYTPRGSPHTGIPALNLSRMATDTDEYVLHHTRYSASPSRLMPMPTLSPLPEVLLNTATLSMAEKAGSRNSTAGKINDGYMNMDYGASKSSVANIQPPRFTFEELPGSGEVTPTMPSTPSRAETSLPVRIPLKTNEDKENSVVSQPPIFLVDTETLVSSSGNGTSSAATPTNSIPSKQRANSLEKIVCALEKAIIGPKRHSSGDKPKRSGGTLIHRSNSYQPSSASRVIIAGSKPASLFPLLTDIPAGKVMSISTKESHNGKNTKSLPGQQATTSTSRTSSSSLVSLGEDSIAGELQAVNWNSATTFIPLTVGQSPTTLPSKSPSPSLLSRPTSVQSERAIHYAQLDLTQSTGNQRSTPKDDFLDEVPKSPRIPRPTSASTVFGADVTTTYAQIDFKKSEGIKTSNP